VAEETNLDAVCVDDGRAGDVCDVCRCGRSNDGMVGCAGADVGRAELGKLDSCVTASGGITDWGRSTTVLYGSSGVVADGCG